MHSVPHFILSPLWFKSLAFTTFSYPWKVFMGFDGLCSQSLFLEDKSFDFHLTLSYWYELPTCTDSWNPHSKSAASSLERLKKSFFRHQQAQCDWSLEIAVLFFLSTTYTVERLSGGKCMIWFLVTLTALTTCGSRVIKISIE